MKLLAFLESLKPLNEGIMDAMIETAIPEAINTLRDDVLSGNDSGVALELFRLHEYGDPHEEPDDTYENIERKYAEWLAEWCEARVEHAAYDIVNGMSHNRQAHMDGIVIYRVIRADENFPSNIKARGLGEYWSWEEGAAEAHWAGDGDITYLIVGLVDPRHVDWEHSLFQNAHPSFEHEKELYIPEGSPIELYKLLLGNGDEVDPQQYGGRQQLQASLGESSDVLYHGTSLGHWTEGTSADALHGNLYLTNDPKIANQHAESASESWYERYAIENDIDQDEYAVIDWPKEGQPIIVVFDMSRLAGLDGVELEPDWEMPNMGRGSTWRDSLAQHSTLSVSGFKDEHKSLGKIISKEGESRIAKGARFARTSELREARDRLSHVDAMKIIREIETGRGGIAELMNKKPHFKELSQAKLRSEHGDVVPLFRVLTLPEGKEMRDEGIVSTSTDWNVALHMGINQPGVVMTRGAFITLRTVLLRYDTPVEQCLADVHMLLDMAVEAIGGIPPDHIKIKGRRGGTASIAHLIKEGMKEDEVIADVSGIEPVVLDFDRKKELDMVRGMGAGEFDSPDEYMQHRDATKGTNEFFPPDEQEQIKAMYAQRAPDVKRFLGQAS